MFNLLMDLNVIRLADPELDLYEILDASFGSTNDEIKINYNKKIKPYCNLPFLNDKQKKYIKLLKTAKYVLTDEKLKEKYNVFKLLENSELTEYTSNNFNNKLNEAPLPLRKDQKLNCDEISERSFLRFNNQKLDLDKERLLGGYF